MDVDVRPHLDLLDLDGALLLARLGGLLLRLIFVLAVIQDLAHRRLGIGRDLDQVEPRLNRARQGFGRGDHADIVAGSVDELDVRDVDALVDARAALFGGKLRRPSYDVSFSSAGAAAIPALRRGTDVLQMLLNSTRCYSMGSGPAKSSRRALSGTAPLKRHLWVRLPLRAPADRRRPGEVACRAARHRRRASCTCICASSNCALTLALRPRADRRPLLGCSSSAAPIALGEAVRSPGGTSQPVKPGCLCIRRDDGFGQRAELAARSPGQPMACASTLVRPKVSGTARAVMATWAARKAAGISGNGRRAAPSVARPCRAMSVDQLLAIGSLARRVAGEHDHRVVERALGRQAPPRPRSVGAGPSAR